MNKKRIINIGYGRTTLRDMYDKGDMSSRLFYGLIELEEKYNVRQVSFNSRSGLWHKMHNNLLMLRKADAIYMTYLYEQPLFLYALLKKLGLIRKRKLIVVSHKQLKTGSSWWQNQIYRMVYHSIDMVFFHSQRNLDESVGSGMTIREKAQFLYWGDDLAYVDRTYHPKQGDFFISTGRENRDFNTLLNAFAQTDAKLELYTNRVNYENNYEDLEQWQDRFNNISIEFTDKTNNTTLRLAKRTAEARCVVIPLMKQQVNYCVGLTSIVEAMALGKPIITSPNPYSPVDVQKEGVGFVANTIEEWISAIRYLQTHPDEAVAMGRRARLLAEQHYNIKTTTQQLDNALTQLLMT